MAALHIRKSRSKNFSVDEENTIQSMVEFNSSILNCKFSNTVTNKRKGDIWQEITDCVNTKGVAERTVREVREKWGNMAQKAKKVFTEYRIKQKGTGGGPPPTEISEATTRIIDSMKDTASFSGVPGGIDCAIEITNRNYMTYLSDSPPEGAINTFEIVAPESSQNQQQPSTNHSSFQPSTSLSSIQSFVSHIPIQPSTGISSSQPSTSQASIQPSTSHASIQPSTSHASSQPCTSHASIQPVSVPVFIDPNMPEPATVPTSSLSQPIRKKRKIVKITQDDVLSKQYEVLQNQLEQQNIDKEKLKLESHKFQLQIQLLEKLIAKDNFDNLDPTQILMSLMN